MKAWTNEDTQPFATAWRQARVLKIVDGDTADLNIALGFDVEVVSRIRLLKEEAAITERGGYVDAWETRGAEREKGALAKARAIELCPVGSTVRIYSFKGGSRGKYGRWLSVILYFPDDETQRWYSLGDTLILEGHAE